MNLHSRGIPACFLKGLLGLVIVPFGLAACQAIVQKVDFVGCPADGQVGYQAPPTGEPMVVNVAGVASSEIAYYKGVSAPGAFGPRGWHCRVWYGSGGGVLLVTPEKLDSAPGFAWPAKTTGQAVEVSFDSGETSGRFAVAKYAMLFFPGTAATFIQSVNALTDAPISPKDLNPFASDSVRVVSPILGEFVTPANAEGLGTERYLRPAADPISGIAFLDQSSGSEPSFVTLRVRLNPAASNMKTVLLRLNRECMQQNRGCSTR